MPGFPCRTFPGESCLLTEGPIGERNCLVCRRVIHWLEGQFDTVYVQDCSTAKNVLLLIPAHSGEPQPERCVMELNAATHSPQDLRATLTLLANISDEVRLRYEEPVSHAIREQP